MWAHMRQGQGARFVVRDDDPFHKLRAPPTSRSPELEFLCVVRQRSPDTSFQRANFPDRQVSVCFQRRPILFLLRLHRRPDVINIHMRNGFILLSSCFICVPRIFCLFPAPPNLSCRCSRTEWFRSAATCSTFPVLRDQSQLTPPAQGHPPPLSTTCSLLSFIAGMAGPLSKVIARIYLD